MAHKLTDEQEIKLAEMYASNEYSVAEICRTFDVARVTAHRIAARRGVRRPVGRQPLVFSREEIETMVELAQQQVSHAEIGRRFGTSQCKVSRLLEKENIVSSRGRSRRRENHGSWKGGRIKMAQGYMAVLIDADDEMASMRLHNGYVLEHRLVMARSLGRPLTKNENVHHINGIKDDNRLENLELWTRPQPRGVRADQASHCVTCTCGKLG